MTRSRIVKRIAWTAAMLTLPVLAVSAYAGDKSNRHGKKQGHSQVQSRQESSRHHESGQHKSRNRSSWQFGNRHNRYGYNHSRSYSRHYGYSGGHQTRHHRRRSNHDGFGFRISFGSHNRARVVYSHNYSDRSCCTSGYYINRWVPAVTSVRYDDDNRPYTVVIRDGYNSQQWVPGRCSRGIHHHGNRY